MFSKNRFRWTLAVLLALCLPWPAGAGITLSGTRVILGEKDREASIPVKNTSTSPYVVQTWIDAGEGQNKTPLLVTPPLSRLDPGMENILRIMRVAGDLPADRESVFWLNVKEIPERSKEENVLQIAVRSRIKLFYRPARLAGKPEESRAQLQWVVSPGPEGRGAECRSSRCAKDAGVTHGDSSWTRGRHCLLPSAGAAGGGSSSAFTATGVVPWGTRTCSPGVSPP